MSALKQESCAIERIEFKDAKIDESLATILNEGIALDKCSIKELTFKNCRFSFNGMRSLMQAM